MQVFSEFANNIRLKKYAHPLPGGGKETWEQTAHRVASNVFGAVSPPRIYAPTVERLIANREFMPGGRYLASTGRQFHQTQNCFDAGTRFITDKGPRMLGFVGPDEVVQVRNRFGDWEEARVKCFGEQEIWEIDTANGLTINTTKDHLWWQEDGTRVTTEHLKEIPFSKAPEPFMDEEGIRHGIVFGDGHAIKERYSQIVFVNKDKGKDLVHYFKDEVKQVQVGFGATINVRTVRWTNRGWIVSLLPLGYKELPEKYSPEYARGFIAGLIATDGCTSGSGSVTISCEGFVTAYHVAAIAVAGGCIVNSVRIASDVSPFDGSPREMCTISIKPHTAPILREYHRAKMSKAPRKNFKTTVQVRSVRATGRVEKVYCVVAPKTESFTLANGLITSNCLLLRAQDSREGWSELSYKCFQALMTGAGIGVVYSDVRAKGKIIRRTGGRATGPIALMQIINDGGRQIRQGGERRSAIWAGLHWWHEDIFEFIEIKNWQKEVRELKAKHYSFPATLDGTNISVILDREFFNAFDDESHPKHAHAHQVYWRTVKQMVSTAEPGFSIDYDDPSECLRNACTEVSSSTTDDICNLGSINMGKVDSLEKMKELVHFGSAFLLAGTVYSHVPYPQVDHVRSKNRRLGLGLMGLHEWLIKRGKKYGPDAELGKYLEVYAQSTEVAAEIADMMELSHPVKTRAIAPTGTIGIVAETTGGIEPIFCVAYKRRYLKTMDVFAWEYVIDPAAKRLIDQGINPDAIEDAYSISYQRRIEFQAWVQQYVDHGISSTINTPRWGSEKINEGNYREFGEYLYGYLPKLRGITCYPDGAREGQPMTAVPYLEAARATGVVHEEQGDACSVSKGGSCGD